jgi:DNA invertase Pin-like site-specific DNA recombinase
MTMLFAAYVRTSTEDHQSPDDSRRWQLNVAEQLIGPHDGHVVAVFHDIDVSRSVPWARRPEASRLMAEAALPSEARAWQSLVVAEPQRAFSGNQFGLVFPVLAHYGVDLWVPEVGGRVDPESEAHDLVMSLFSGLGKAERNRLRIRTRAAMHALAAEGRWLGGRPNYGYRVVDTATVHPHPEQAAAGVHLRTLEPDPDTAPVVGRIFELFDAGLGYKGIARRLEAEGIQSPGEVGPRRHPRSSGVWGGSAVRAILINPRYLGRQVAGRQRRHDELLDATDPALGTISRQRRQAEPDWTWAKQESWPPLVPADLWQSVNQRITNTPSGGSRQPRSEPGRYLLAGRVRCERCGRSMNGSTMKGKPYYRCASTRPDYAIPSAPDHPPTLAVREERILVALDTWLATLTDVANLDATVAAIVQADTASHRREPAVVTRARRDVHRLTTELDRLLAAIRAGLDPVLAAGETRKVQAELARAEATVRAWDADPDRTRPLTHDQVLAALIAAGGLVGLLENADRTQRAKLYTELGLTVDYQRETATERIHVRSQLSGGGGTG